MLDRKKKYFSDLCPDLCASFQLQVLRQQMVMKALKEATVSFVKIVPINLNQKRVYIIGVIILILLTTNLVILNSGTYFVQELQIERPQSLAHQLYIDNDLDNPRFQRARIWYATDSYDEDMKGEFSGQKNFGNFDPRLAPALWFNLINKNLKNDVSLLPEDFKLPFAWNMILNLSDQLLAHPYYEKVIAKKMTCKEFVALDKTLRRKYKNQNIPFCVDYNYEEPNFHNPYNLPFKLTDSDHMYLDDLEVRKLYAILYCISGLPAPSKILFLGAVDNQMLKKSLIVPLAPVLDQQNLPNKEIGHSVLKTYSDGIINEKLKKGENLHDILEKGMSTFNELDIFNDFILHSSKFMDILAGLNIDQIYEKPTVLGIGQSSFPLQPMRIERELFEWNVDREIDVIGQQIEAAQIKEPLIHLESLLTDKRDNLVAKEPTYWGLASSREERLDHFDFRFFRFNVKEEDALLHQLIVHRLTRVWFKLCREFGVPTWLNHGPLIGWWWNGLTMPYDSDIDVQLPIQSLMKLAKLVNDTLIYDFINEEEYINDEKKIDSNAELGLRSFYFEVADSFVTRTNLLSVRNNIDARLLDTSTGIYIDITALLSLTSYTNGDIGKQLQVFHRLHGRQVSRFILSRFYDQFYDGVSVKPEIRRLEGDRVWKQIANESIRKLEEYVKDINLHQEELALYVNDRNYHFYNIEELNPLVPTFYENYNTYVPSNFLKNLIVEYTDKHVVMSSFYLNYKFFEKIRLWVKHTDCPVYKVGGGTIVFYMNEKEMNDKCYEMSEFVREEVKKLNDFTEFHADELSVLIGGDPRNLTLLDAIAESRSPLNYKQHVEFISNHSSHILRPDPYMVENFY